MKVRNVLFGAAAALVVIGSLLGVGCKSSSKNTTATATPQMQGTTTPAGASPVSQSQTTATYTVVLQIGPAVQMMMSAATATSGEVMVPMSGMATPSMMMTDQGHTVNHHLEVHITKTATGAVVTDTVPTVTITNAATNASRDLTDVAAMYDAAVGTSDTHFGNNLYLPDGRYTVTVKVGQETAQFSVTVSNGATPAAMRTEAMMTTGTPAAMMTPAATQMLGETPTP